MCVHFCTLPVSHGQKKEKNGSLSNKKALGASPPIGKLSPDRLPRTWVPQSTPGGTLTKFWGMTFLGGAEGGWGKATFHANNNGLGIKEQKKKSICKLGFKFPLS